MNALSEDFPGNNANLIVWMHFFEGAVFALAGRESREQRMDASAIVTIASEIASEAYGELLLQVEMLEQADSAKGEAQ